MSWNHRVIKTANPDGSVDFSIHEVYYDKNGLLSKWTERPVSPCGETMEELAMEICMFGAALFKGVIDYEIIKEYEKGEPETE